MNRVLIVALSIALTACGADNTAQVDTYLRQTFPNGNALRYEEGLSRPSLVEAPALRRILPQTQFYRTRVRTTYFEYPEVQILIAARRNDSATTYTYRSSPTFDDNQPEFFASFAGGPVPTGERESVARAIAELLASITYAGRVGAVSTEAATVSVELWHGELMWRRVVVLYTSSNTIESIELNKP